MSSDFKFYAPLRFFKSGEGEHARRIAGVVSTETPDRQGDTILQRGLNFDEFLKFGWFNDNHSQKAQDVLGYPERVQFFEKGERLPDGSVAHAPLHWAEGYLLSNYEPAERLWNLGLSLQKAGGGRSLGFSVEGKIVRRTGPSNKIIARADVRNVAITHCPVNADTKLYALAKSLHAAEESSGDDSWDLVRSLMDQFGKPDAMEDGEFQWLRGPAKITLSVQKGLSAGTGGPEKPVGEFTGAGAGRVLMPQSLEKNEKRAEKEKALDKDCGSAKMTKSQAIAYIRERMGATEDQASHLVALLAQTTKNG